MSSTDYLRLNELKIFQKVRESSTKRLNKSTKLLTVKDGVLFVWDFADECVLTLNVRAARSRDGDNVTHQTLLPLNAILFKPEFLEANEAGTLLLIAGPSGISVLELPLRYPPYGAFGQNKEVVYCQNHSLDERLLLCSDLVQVRQVRFHPGSPRNSHILALTSDNTFRLYNIENSTAVNVATFQIGETPHGVFPGTKTSYLAAFGEVGVDFDFGQPEIVDADRSLLWPALVVRGDGTVLILHVPLDASVKPVVMGPVITNTSDKPGEEACSIICIGSNPEIVCIANSNGTVYHSVLLKIPQDEYDKMKVQQKNPPQMELLCFESVDLELGLSTVDVDNSSYTCPVFLHKDESKTGRYFATHSAGIHSVTINCLKDLQRFISEGKDNEPATEDLFIQESKAEYLLCTKTSTSTVSNPVIGFSLYYEPTAILAILNDGNLISLGILTTDVLPPMDEIAPTTKSVGDNNSPLKKILKEPFDEYIQKILKKSTSQPILKLAESDQHSSKKCHEVLERASQVFRAHFENHTLAREELEKRTKMLQMMKEFQLKELDRIMNQKQLLQERAESLAEKYEDIKDDQTKIMKRCEKLLVLVAQKKSEPSDAEKEFLNELVKYKDKIETHKKLIEKLKLKMNYQKVQMKSWKQQEEKKNLSSLGEVHYTTIKTNLQEMSEKIADMIKEINVYKERLNLK